MEGLGNLRLLEGTYVHPPQKNQHDKLRTYMILPHVIGVPFKLIPHVTATPQRTSSVKEFLPEAFSLMAWTEPHESSTLTVKSLHTSQPRHSKSWLRPRHHEFESHGGCRDNFKIQLCCSSSYPSSHEGMVGKQQHKAQTKAFNSIARSKSRQC